MDVDKDYYLQFLNGLEELQKEQLTWKSHPLTKAFLSKNKLRSFDAPLLDVESYSRTAFSAILGYNSVEDGKLNKAHEPRRSEKT